MEVFLGIVFFVIIIWFFSAIANTPSDPYHKTQHYRSKIAGKVGRSLGRSLVGKGPRRWRL